jgi:hypothetical protein
VKIHHSIEFRKSYQIYSLLNKSFARERERGWLQWDLFDCAVFGYSMCVNPPFLQNPISIVCHACALMSWAGLNLKEDKELLEASVNTMLQIALKLLNKKMKTDTILLLNDDSENSQKD